MPKTYEPIKTTTLSSTAATVTLSSIPATYTDLILISSYSTTASLIYLQYNGDAGSNYSETHLIGNGSTATSGRRNNQTRDFCGYTGSSTNSNIISHIQNYANTSVFKSIIHRSNDTTDSTELTASLWRSTAAINSVLIGVNTGNFTVGSTFTLYGIKAA